MQADDIIDFIYDYFNGLEIECTEYEDYYQVVVWANQYTYCEDISQGLDYLGISESDVSEYCLINDNMALCLSENWLPYAFAYLSTRDGCSKAPMNIIHVDDHSDLMSPFICYENKKYYDMLSGDEVCFNESESLRRAVRSGAITIGSMLTAIVYAMSKTNILHIKNGANSQEYELVKTTFFDKLLHNGCQRIVIEKQKNEIGADKYFITDNWDDLEKRMNPDFPCLLHIDMDYFNNRYNASTSWRENQDRYDPDFVQQKHTMDKLIASIENISKITNIQYVLIGISPSFYPAEYWEDGLNYITTGLQRIGIGVGNKIIQNPRENEYG